MIWYDYEEGLKHGLMVELFALYIYWSVHVEQASYQNKKLHHLYIHCYMYRCKRRLCQYMWLACHTCEFHHCTHQQLEDRYSTDKIYLSETDFAGSCLVDSTDFTGQFLLPIHQSNDAYLQDKTDMPDRDCGSLVQSTSDMVLLLHTLYYHSHCPNHLTCNTDYNLLVTLAKPKHAVISVPLYFYHHWWIGW